MAVSVLARLHTLGDGIFAFNLKYLFLVGLWPEDDLTKAQKAIYRSYECILHSLTIIMFIITGIGTYRNRNNITIFLSNMDKTLIQYNFFFKIVLFILKRDKIRELIEEIQNSDDIVTEKRKKLMVKSILMITVTSLIIVSIFSALAIYNGEMAIEAWMPFDPLESRMHLITSGQIMAVLFVPGLFRAFAMQGLVCSLIMYLGDQLVDLQNSIKKLKYTKEMEFEIRKKFKNAIKKHIRLMR